ncbi:hypothetical protein DL95DRAFT_459833 [Leptodontidium sp. 2 PMI_412]|nr:hypothetical protein DL95DRAFT_459833 [Leptodontidium sp. 2 PMI_412]
MPVPAKLVPPPEREDGGYFKRTGLNPYSTIVVGAVEATLKFSGRLPSQIESTDKAGYLDNTLKAMGEALKQRELLELGARSGSHGAAFLGEIRSVIGRPIIVAICDLLQRRRRDLIDLMPLANAAVRMHVLTAALLLGFSPPDGSELTWLRGNRKECSNPMMEDFAVFSALYYDPSTWGVLRRALGPEKGVCNSRGVDAIRRMVDRWGITLETAVELLDELLHPFLVQQKAVV